MSAEIVGNWITKVSKSSLQNNLEIVESEAENKEIPKERYIIRKKTASYWWSKISLIMEYQKIIDLLKNNKIDKEIPKERYPQKKECKLLIIYN